MVAAAVVNIQGFSVVKVFSRHDSTVTLSSDSDGAINRNGAVDNLEG